MNQLFISLKGRGIMEKAKENRALAAKQAEEIYETVLHEVAGWEFYAKDSIGKRLLSAASSIEANITRSERYDDSLRRTKSLHLARGSLWETKFWLTRALDWKVISPTRHDQLLNGIVDLAPRLEEVINEGGSFTRILTQSQVSRTYH